jgi:hypothetical protein
LSKCFNVIKKKGIFFIALEKIYIELGEEKRERESEFYVR